MALECLLLDLPIRDGNGLTCHVLIARIRLLDLPIRDGNFSSGDLNGSGAKLLDLPIRDGNCRLDSLSADALTTFRPSYQGWKLLFMLAVLI